MSLNVLPEDCVFSIFSLTSPQDACRLPSVSSAFRSTADSDAIWDRFLPSDYREILGRSVSPLFFSSKKELFFLLSNGVQLDGGNKRFAIDKQCGKKSFTLSAKELSILHADDPNHWNWISIPESRFTEVAELKTVTSLDIQGTIKTELLSPNTTYGAYLIIKILDRSFGLDSIPSEVYVTVGEHYMSANTAILQKNNDQKKLLLESLLYANRMQMLKKRVNRVGDERLPSERNDGWMEIELGEFFSGEEGDEDNEVTMRLMEVLGHHLKGGLIVEGLEIRPKH